MARHRENNDHALNLKAKQAIDNGDLAAANRIVASTSRKNQEAIAARIRKATHVRKTQG